MKTLDIPQTTLLHTGRLFKVLQVRGNKGTSMPDHFCTHEAVIIVQRGSAILRMAGLEYPLTLNRSFIIPAGENHSLTIEDDLEANVVMKIDSQIKFVNS